QRAERREGAARRDAELRNEVGAAVAQAVTLRQDYHFREARELLERARQSLERAGPDDLRRRVSQGRADLELAIQLDDIRMKRATRGDLDLYKAQANREYAATFRQAGLGASHDPPPLVAARIADSPVSGTLVAALYDWSVCA